MNGNTNPGNNATAAQKDTIMTTSKTTTVQLSDLFASETRNLLADALKAHTSAAQGRFVSCREAGILAGLDSNTHPLRACKALAAAGDVLAQKIGRNWFFAAIHMDTRCTEI